MPKAYVGIASPHGLAVLQPEQDETLSAVERYVELNRLRVGFWAVLGDDDACSVRALFRCGHRREALVLLDRSAKEIGRILPNETVRPLLQ
ncbi:hypothetical protein J0H58_01985 [bacterium]|nr:hypothetical protein [bacterium]